MNSLLVKYPQLLRLLYPKRLSVISEAKSIYLTFDDGPISGVTPWVLEQLSRFDARATFFCIGDNIRKHPQVFKQILAEGHSIGNHTYNHLNGWKTSEKDYLKNTAKAQELIKEFQLKRKEESGEWKLESEKFDSKFFRPPYGRIKNRQASTLTGLGYKIVMWDIISWDFDKKIKPEECYQNVIRNSKEGSIVVFHDSLKASGNLKEVLPRVLQYYSEKGFCFKAL
ncbi:MAG: polysaccharide deacetylase family protein [Salegentibacter sp.]